MFSNFKEVFNPTPEQKRKQKERLKEIIDLSYKEKWCCTCQNYIPAKDAPGFVCVLPECKLGGLATRTCEKYIQEMG